MLPKLFHVMAHVQKDNICLAHWDKLGGIWNSRGGSAPSDMTDLWSSGCHYASLRGTDNHPTQNDGYRIKQRRMKKMNNNKRRNRYCRFQNYHLREVF